MLIMMCNITVTLYDVASICSRESAEGWIWILKTFQQTTSQSIWKVWNHFRHQQN